MMENRVAEADPRPRGGAIFSVCRDSKLIEQKKNQVDLSTLLHQESEETFKHLLRFKRRTKYILYICTC